MYISSDVRSPLMQECSWYPASGMRERSCSLLHRLALHISGAVAAKAMRGQQVLDPGRHLIILAGDGHCRGVAICHLCMQKNLARSRRRGRFIYPYQSGLLSRHEIPLIWHGRISWRHRLHCRLQS